ncbi:hypothetical protein AB205_0126500 [Aquarana catesbeiana]|uniref:Uncharacterized protein n=1 Tax=Aquarana catesbeiana TaxID=8400 RepID=A0A2G9RN37_AQUCT|nr:hypothetical protein AB205_0126500 [Aquarana catesbeiana]
MLTLVCARKAGLAATVLQMWMNVLKGSIFVTSMQCAPTHLDPTIVPVTVAIGEMALPVLKYVYSAMALQQGTAKQQNASETLFLL